MSCMAYDGLQAKWDLETHLNSFDAWKTEVAATVSDCVMAYSGIAVGRYYHLLICLWI